MREYACDSQRKVSVNLSKVFSDSLSHFHLSYGLPLSFLPSVHNWTQEEVLRWLKDFVELPQYERNFKDFRVNGNTLPR